MKKNNPYEIMFGKEPAQMIPRITQSEEIFSSFTGDHPATQIYMITGMRGFGKTVLMTEVSGRLAAQSDWIVVELNPGKDLLTGLAARIYNERRISNLFKSAKINLSFFGIGLEKDAGERITDIEVALDRMLEQLAKKKKKLLVTIDEVTSSSDMRVFASAFQIYIRKNYPLFLIMTGLYENVNALQNDNILTFLYRAPKIHLKPLNLGSIARNYAAAFSLDEADAREMAKLTLGYPFAFQVLGYYTFENGGNYKTAVDNCRLYLDEYVYDKIWSELSRKDKEVVHGIASSDSGKVTEIRSALGMEPNAFSPYRDRLIKKGIVTGEDYGCLSFTLPFFSDYVKSR